MNRISRRVPARGPDLTLTSPGALLRLEDRTVPTVLDLTTAGAGGSLNGALFEQVAAQSTGTGGIDPVVRLQGGPVEQGYNSDHRPVEFDEKTGSNFTRSVRLGDVSTEVRNGVRYRKFLLDVNETRAGSSSCRWTSCRSRPPTSRSSPGTRRTGRTAAGQSCGTTWTRARTASRSSGSTPP